MSCSLAVVRWKCVIISLSWGECDKISFVLLLGRFVSCTHVCKLTIRTYLRLDMQKFCTPFHCSFNSSSILINDNPPLNDINSIIHPHASLICPAHLLWPHSKSLYRFDSFFTIIFCDLFTYSNFWSSLFWWLILRSRNALHPSTTIIHTLAKLYGHPWHHYPSKLMWINGSQ